jgi:hypothetical protein
MAVDGPSSDDLEEVRLSDREKLPERGQPNADGAAAEPEIGETRTPAEYYQALNAAVEQQQAHGANGTSDSADTRRRSAWDDIAVATRPPLDALRVSPERMIHILDGDGTGGGHRYGTGSPGRTEFPAHWNDDTILNAITTVAHSPEDVHRQWNQRWKARGQVDNVPITVIIQPDGAIWTAWPEEGGPGVVRNPKAGGS